MLRLSKKILIYFLVLVMTSFSLYGCNNNDAAGEDNVAEGEDNGAEGAEDTPDDALNDAVADALDDGSAPNEDEATPAPENGGAPNENAASGATAEPVKTAIGERSPVEITRVEVPLDDDDEELKPGALNEKDEHEHEVTPNLFPVDKCQVEIQGLYKVKLAQDLLKEVNKRRAERNIGALSPNTSLHACADARCKEQTYFVGHFRPDGSAFDSVGRGYVQGECIAIDYRTVNDIMEAWFAVNESRYQIMNPDYTQVGISIYDIDDIYYIAAEFGW